MAKIADFVEAPAERVKVHGDVECGYRIFTSRGKRYIQLDTYGSTDRAMPGRVSQSIQLDRASAEQLLEILERAFPEIGGRSR